MTNNLQLKKQLIFLWKKLAIYLYLGLHKGCPSYRKSLQPSKENIQHFKTWSFIIFFYFCGSFLPSWIRIWIHWPYWICNWIRIWNRQSNYGAELGEAQHDENRSSSEVGTQRVKQRQRKECTGSPGYTGAVVEYLFTCHSMFTIRGPERSLSRGKEKLLSKHRAEHSQHGEYDMRA